MLLFSSLLLAHAHLASSVALPSVNRDSRLTAPFESSTGASRKGLASHVADQADSLDDSLISSLFAEGTIVSSPSAEDTTSGGARYQAVAPVEMFGCLVYPYTAVIAASLEVAGPKYGASLDECHEYCARNPECQLLQYNEQNGFCAVHGSSEVSPQFLIPKHDSSVWICRNKAKELFMDLVDEQEQEQVAHVEVQEKEDEALHVQDKEEQVFSAEAQELVQVHAESDSPVQEVVMLAEPTDTDNGEGLRSQATSEASHNYFVYILLALLFCSLTFCLLKRKRCRSIDINESIEAEVNEDNEQYVIEPKSPCGLLNMIGQPHQTSTPDLFTSPSPLPLFRLSPIEELI